MPSDTISSVQIAGNNNYFCTSSWDGDVCIWSCSAECLGSVLFDSI